MDLSQKLVGLRRAKGWTQKEAAQRARIQPAYLCRLEKGSQKSPGLDVLERLAAGLEVSVGFLADREIEPEAGSFLVAAQRLSLEKFLKERPGALSAYIADKLETLISDGEGEVTVGGWRTLYRRLMRISTVGRPSGPRTRRGARGGIS